MKRENTKSVQIFTELKDEIFGGRYGQCRSFPSEVALARRFGVSRSLMTRIVSDLERMGLVIRRQGSGTVVAKGVAQRKIGLIMPDVTQSEYFVRIYRELVRIAEREQYVMLFGEIQGKTAKARAASAEKLVNDFIEQKVAGVIFQPIEYYDEGEEFNRRMLAWLDAAQIPVVLCDNGLAIAECKYDVVGNNNIAASIVMYRHLVEAGAKRICFFMRPYSAYTHFARAQGVVLAQLPKIAGTVRRESLLIAEPDDDKAILRRIKGAKVDAFMCGDDETAARLMQTLCKLGYKIPDDILVSGFNDLNVARLLSPSLTTLRANCEQIADMAFNRLSERIANPGLLPTEISIPVELVVRESTRLTEKTLKRSGR